MKVYFYPHAYLRDRQIDTIRHWPSNQIVNPELAENRLGAQVSSDKSVGRKFQLSWKQRLPLLNIKRRPPGASDDAVVYVWGAVMASGPYIVDIDNPWSLVGYNIGAMSIYRPILKHMLLDARCHEIRCMSNACRESLRLLFGHQVWTKARVSYPLIEQKISDPPQVHPNEARFLFVGTQFEIKGGEALLKAFSEVYARQKACRLDIVTHMPEEFENRARSCAGIFLHQANFSRAEIHDRFMRNADILVLPTYVDSFGMVILEALSHGLAVIATDVYAIKEMVIQGQNGDLLDPPISIWDGRWPSASYRDLANIKSRIRSVDKTEFEKRLAVAMQRFVIDSAWRLCARRASIDLMSSRFSC